MLYSFIINSKSLNDSNDALIRLWNAFNEYYGKIGWLYQPYKPKNSNIITLGSLSCNKHSFNININTKGPKTINSVDIYSKKTLSFLEKQKLLLELEEIDKLRNNLIKETYTAAIEINIKPLLDNHIDPINIRTDNFCLFEFNKKFYLYCKIQAYGTLDFKEKALMIFNKLIDYFSVFFIAQIDIVNNRESINIQYTCNQDSFTSKYFESKHIQFIDKLLEIEDFNNYILLASHHFHNAIKLFRYDVSVDLEIVSLVSILESLALETSTNSEICSQCGKPNYSISKSVSDLITSHFGYSIISDYTDKFYNFRSKFLHAGKNYVQRSYSGTCIPTLDPYQLEGMINYGTPNLTFLPIYQQLILDHIN